MRAKVTKSFPGVPDKEVYPKTFNVGEIIDGDLARVAVSEKWAVEVGEDDAEIAPQQTEAPAPKGAKGAKGKGKVADVAAADTSAATAVHIPDDWKTLTSGELKDLAKQLVDGEITDDDSAAAAIEAEIAKRAPKA